MARISVIVPARDVGGYIGPLLGDLRHQTLGDLEVLVVDDGSTDDTREVIERTVGDDPRFTVVELSGQGSSLARNVGVQRASGEFLAFVDADDRLSHRYLEVLHGVLEETGSELACGNVRRLEDLRTHASKLHRQALAEPGLRTHISRAPQLVWDTPVWNKLIRRDFWEEAGLYFEPGRWINDLHPSIRMHAMARQVDLIGEVVYFWRIRTNPSTSITDRKFADPAAQRKSMIDRLWALEMARQTLAASLPVASVLQAFDEKVLLHDLWTYLPFYPDADAEYREQLVSRARELLTWFDIDPARFDVGPLLLAVYRAVLASDHERLGKLLDPATRVAGSVRQQRISGRLDVTRHGPRRPNLGRLVPTRRGRDDGRYPPVADARIDRFDLTGSARATATGVVRIRDGRTDLEGDWTVALVLTGTKSGTTITGTPAPLDPAPDLALHPLQRSGWRPFRATVDLDPATLVGADARFGVAVELNLDGATLAADTLLTSPAARCLTMGISISDVADLVPTPTSTQRLQLRRERVAGRLRDIGVLNAGEVVLHLEVAGTADGAGVQVWLQTPDGEVRTAPQPAGQPVRLPAVLDSGPDRWELWSAPAPEGPARRVRAYQGLHTARVATGTDGSGRAIEAVLRPTVRGRVVLERRAPELELRWARARDGGLVVGGDGDPNELASEPALELHCRWTDERLTVPITASDRGWEATVPAARLPGGGQDRPLSRRWTMHLVDRDGKRRNLRVPPDGRDRFPLVDDACIPPVEVTIGPGSHPQVWALPDHGAGRWTTLRKVERFEAVPTVGTPRA